jgi:hypothetical protein
MTKDDIIRMAREAGFKAANYPSMFSDSEWEALGRFADLAAAHEREEFAKHAVEIARLAIKQEREACAKIAESYEPRCDTCPSGVANAIRARGNT